MSHYKHEIIPAAKFEFGTLTIFGDMTSQTSLVKKGTSHRIRI